MARRRGSQPYREDADRMAGLAAVAVEAIEELERHITDVAQQPLEEGLDVVTPPENMRLPRLIRSHHGSLVNHAQERLGAVREAYSAMRSVHAHAYYLADVPDPEEG